MTIDGQPIIIVTGLPRSGTSMMMAMLEAGGVPILTDGERQADMDNPKGYYEFEQVKQLDKGNHLWLTDAEGKAVKVISALLKCLPKSYRYQIIFLHRSLAEVIASQNKMLKHRGTAQISVVADEKLAVIYEKHVNDTIAWLHAQPNIVVLHVDYHHILGNPEKQAAEVNYFLGNKLDIMRMAQIVDPTLYRNHASF